MNELFEIAKMAKEIRDNEKKLLNTWKGEMEANQRTIRDNLLAELQEICPEAKAYNTAWIEERRYDIMGIHMPNPIFPDCGWLWTLVYPYIDTTGNVVLWVNCRKDADTKSDKNIRGEIMTRESFARRVLIDYV